MSKEKGPTAVERVVVALAARGAVLSLDAARWRLRLASLEPGPTNAARFVSARARAADAELERIAADLLADLAEADPVAAAEFAEERERCAAVREGRWLSPFSGGEVHDHG